MAGITTCARFIGVDAGGTQISVLTDLSDEVTRVSTDTFSSLDGVVYWIIRSFGTPDVIVIGAAGAVGADGCVQMTNRPEWPVFDPSAVGARLGCRITVVNDMVIKVAGISEATVETIHEGRAVSGTTKAVVTVSTGVGSAQPASSESGHTTWQPADELEDAILRQLRQQHDTRYFSVEDVVGGHHLFKLYDALTALGYALSKEDSEYVETCRRNGEDIGPLITRLALSADPFCERFMRVVGSLLGQYFRNLILSALATDGVCLTGGAMKPEVVRYLFEETPLREALLGGSTHNGWIADVPFYLVTDPDLGVKGAAKLAARNG